MSVISLTYNGVEIIDDVIIADAEFESQSNGAAGLCRFRIKDDGHAYERGYFKAGGVLNLRIDGELVWGGWVMSVGVAYAFPVDNTVDPEATPRFYVIEGADWNVLFTRRFIHGTDPIADMATYPGDMQDGDVVRDIIANYTDLLSDGISLDGIRNVGPVSAFGGEEFRPGNQGDPLIKAMTLIVQSNGAIFYIDPNKVFQYRDVEIPTAVFALSDQPALDPPAVGYREMRISFNAQQMANDALVWGAGMGSDEMVFARVTDIESTDLFGTFQWADIKSDVWQEPTVRAMAQSYIYGSATSTRGHRIPLPEVQCVIYQPGLYVGQVVDFISHIFDDDGLEGVVITDPVGTVPANLANFMARIRHIESNGNYSAQNRSSGAYGAYQIMPGNWAAWATEALGYPRSSGISGKAIDPSSWFPPPTQANQDAVATFRFTRAYTWLADWRRIAAMWRSGGSVAVRQPYEWSRGTILYVNHATVPLGYPAVTTTTILPNLP